MILSLENKTALVTGGSRGIGKAIALKLAEYGADVAITYARSVDAAEEVKSEIEKMGRKAKALQADAVSFEKRSHQRNYRRLGTAGYSGK